jgi:two-component system NtrC family response regulator
MVENSDFRQDLYFRLNVVPLALPPVRERSEDILPLFYHFLQEAAESEGKEVPAVDRATAARLEDHAWPGNVREIQNLAQRLMVLHQQGPIAPDELPESIKESPPAEGPSPAALPSQGIDLEEWTDRLILAALERNDWNQSRTARYLNISRNTLVYRIDKHQKLREAWKMHGQIDG